MNQEVGSGQRTLSLSSRSRNAETPGDVSGSVLPRVIRFFGVVLLIWNTGSQYGRDPEQDRSGSRPLAVPETSRETDSPLTHPTSLGPQRAPRVRVHLFLLMSEERRSCFSDPLFLFRPLTYFYLCPSHETVRSRSYLAREVTHLYRVNLILGCLFETPTKAV